MVRLVGNDNEMLLKLSAVSMGLSMAVAKLSAYQRDLLIDAKKK